jgi:hypothetical protein
MAQGNHNPPLAGTCGYEHADYIVNWDVDRVAELQGYKGAACSERDGAIVPRKRQWPDGGHYPVTRGGLILVTKM